MTITATDTRLATKPAAQNTSWRLEAPCGDVEPDLFFPIGINRAAQHQAEEAKSICRTCPVMETCLDWALETRQDSGVWGGMTEEERRAIHRRMRPVYRGGMKTSVDNILEHRVDQVLALVAAGLAPGEMARTLGTNVVTVNTVIRKLTEAGRLEGATA